MEEEKKDYNFNVWQETLDPVFSKICKDSRLPDKWISYDRVANGKYKDSVIKPVNRYVESLYQPPVLISIDGNIVRLRQQNHADYFLLEKENGTFFNLDRPWLRQYYKTKEEFDIPDTCFKATYKMYVPWFIDANVDISYEQVEGSPFHIYPQTFAYEEVDPESKYVEPNFITFNFMRVGSHMVDDKFGKIKRLSPVFDMVFQADDIIVQRVRKFYEQD